MTRTATILAFTASISLSAQTTPAPAPSVTVTGCVAEVQRDGTTAAKASGTGGATFDAAAMEANNPEPTNRYQLVDATPAEPPVPAGTAAKPTKTTYALRGHEAELAKHVGHRVQIAGSLMTPLTAKLPSRAASTADGTRSMQVSAVKMIGSDCSAKPGAGRR